MADNAQALTQERRKTHGDWLEQAQLCDDTLGVWERSRNWNLLPAYKRMALMNIAQKVSRILSGDFNADDHFDDIGGYAHLGNGGHNGQT